MEVLLEIGESKKVLTVTEETLVRVVEEELTVYIRRRCTPSI